MGNLLRAMIYPHRWSLLLPLERGMSTAPPQTDG